MRPKPLFHLGKFPVGVVELIIILEVVGALALSVSQFKIAPAVTVSASAIMSGKVWTALFYPFFSPVSFFWFIGLFFFYQFGRMVEYELGRTSFIRLCAISILTPPVVMVMASLMGLPSSSLSGGSILHLTVFCSFCVIYPNLPTMLLKIPIKWLGIVFFLITLFQFIGAGMVDVAIAAVISTALCLIIVQSQGKAIIKLFPDSWTTASESKKRKGRAVKKQPTRNATKKQKAPYKAKLQPKTKVFHETEVDAILDKISEHGLHSLTEEERQILQKQQR